MSPTGVVTSHDHHVGGFDEGAFQVVVGLLDHPSMSLLATTALNLGNSAGVASRVGCRREAIDGANFQSDDNGKDRSYAG